MLLEEIINNRIENDKKYFIRNCEEEGKHMLKNIKRIKYILIILGLVIIPLYSIFFGANGDLFDMTFSQVGGRFDGKLESLIVWGWNLFNLLFIL